MITVNSIQQGQTKINLKEKTAQPILFTIGGIYTSSI